MIWALIVIVVSFGVVVLFGAPYLPTHRKELARAFEKLHPLSREDVLVDLGSGDGLVLRYAAKQGARAVGYELNLFLIILSWLASARTRNQVRHCWGNYHQADLPEETTVVYVFSTGRHIAGVTRYLEQQANRLQRPLIVISYGFGLPGHQETASHHAHRLYHIAPAKRR